MDIKLSVVEEKKLLAVMASAVPPLTAFHLVNLWTLMNAFSVTFVFADALVHELIFTRHTTVAQPVTTADLYWQAILLCSTLEAFAGTQALLLPCHWRRLRRASAYAGLAVTIAGKCILASAIRAILVDDPGNLLARIAGTVAAFEYVVCNLLAFLVLVRGAGGDEQEGYLINLADLLPSC